MIVHGATKEMHFLIQGIIKKQWMCRTNYILFNILRFNQALKLNPKDDTAWSNKGSALDSLGNY